MTDPMRRTVLFAGGGTAGHVFPALAVAQALRTHDPAIEPVFVGTRDRLEGRLVPAAGFRLYHIDVLPLPRRFSPGVLRVPRALRSAVRVCDQLIVQEQALAAVTFGGYVSFPLSRAAKRAPIPLAVHEQNSVPGLANRFAARWADRVAVSFPGSADRFAHPEKIVVTGNPVREDLLAIDQRALRVQAMRRFRLHPRRRTILVFGGSQGARTLNQAIIDAYGAWQSPDRVQILHVAGRALYGEAAAAWESIKVIEDGPLVRCFDFIDDMAAAYAAADVVVARAGASTIAELTVLGKAAVLVPYPHATRDHQLHNARALQQVGAAVITTDGELNGATLVAAAEPLLRDDAARGQVEAAARAFGRPDAADNVARLVLDLVRSGVPRGSP